MYSAQGIDVKFSQDLTHQRIYKFAPQHGCHW